MHKHILRKGTLKDAQIVNKETQNSFHFIYNIKTLTLFKK